MSTGSLVFWIPVVFSPWGTLAERRKVRLGCLFPGPLPEKLLGVFGLKVTAPVRELFSYHFHALSFLWVLVTAAFPLSFRNKDDNGPHLGHCSIPCGFFVPFPYFCKQAPLLNYSVYPLGVCRGFLTGIPTGTPNQISFFSSPLICF